MSLGADNALKQWVFDNADGTARLLKFRCGHRAPPNCIKFYGEVRMLHFTPKFQTVFSNTISSFTIYALNIFVVMTAVIVNIHSKINKNLSWWLALVVLQNNVVFLYHFEC